MATLLVTHPCFVNHLTGPGHPERPDRMRAIDRVLSHDLFKDLERAEAPLRDDVEEQILLAHPAYYLEQVKAVNAKAADVYRYMNFDQIAEFKQAADAVAA